MTTRVLRAASLRRLARETGNYSASVTLYRGPIERLLDSYTRIGQRIGMSTTALAARVQRHLFGISFEEERFDASHLQANVRNATPHPNSAGGCEAVGSRFSRMAVAENPKLANRG